MVSPVRTSLQINEACCPTPADPRVHTWARDSGAACAAAAEMTTEATTKEAIRFILLSILEATPREIRFGRASISEAVDAAPIRKARGVALVAGDT